ncbi:DMT family transporter [Anaerosinus massiliensis]|uniref:DMT family transporter n=1 Tax=Massilibacillus massiliensis TaxID=1806837 RepID=UPI000DA63A0E|nr:EamA family transporter [Massilibacillus massiliensis]
MYKILRILQQKLSPVTLANLAMIITMIAWGTSFISTKIVLKEVPPITLAFIRFFITSIILYGIIKKTEPNTFVASADKWRLALIGFIGISIYFYLENTGIKFTSASNASLITSFVPILSIALNMLFFKARLSGLEAIGVFIGIIGAYLTITANGTIDFTSDNFKGNLYMIGAMIAWAIYTLLSKKMQKKYSGLCILTYQTIFATLSLIPFTLLEYNTWQTISATSFLHILYLASICSALGYFLYGYALKTVDVVITTLYLNCVPVVGVISGYLILNETILPIQIFGGMIIIAGIFIANLNHTLALFSKK